MEILLELAPVLGTVIGSFLGVVASAKLTTYRIEQLEAKVEKHNGVIERVFKLEGQVSELEHFRENN